MALYYSKINHEHREILLRNRPEKLYQLSPKGTVPVLELPNGDVIEESLDIMKWALSINDPEMWFDQNSEKQVDLIKLNDDKFKKWLDKYKYHVRFPEYPLNYYRKECEKILDIHENRLKYKSFFSEMRSKNCPVFSSTSSRRYFADCRSEYFKSNSILFCMVFRFSDPKKQKKQINMYDF